MNKPRRNIEKIFQSAESFQVTGRLSPETCPEPDHAEIFEVIGQAIRALLVSEPEEVKSIQNLTGTLWWMSVSVRELRKKKPCLAAISLIAAACTEP
ncbi:hypothetical protein [Pantoea sp. At-9b]|uniref:hypothetical protein n=1 Tax=Pantoea sp. (strain At-9b) TaxID=592316 RepID=UPI0001B3FDF1|nr:hypothetical protein [Pantoea sp. At-9b]ADU72196.1 hypothetical protein Pat9b_4887 [Pantoea sp. At-9b]